MRDFSYLRAGSVGRGATRGRSPRDHAAGRRHHLARSRQMRRRRTREGRRHHPPQRPGPIRVDADGASIGALAKMSRVADDAAIKAQFPAVSEALWQAASAQIRNMATIGGNLMQRTRCAYFRDPATFPACNKRAPGCGCSAIGGVTRNHAVLGDQRCLHRHLSRRSRRCAGCVRRRVHLGERQVAVDDFFLLPGATPEREHAMQPGEMITAISIPGLAPRRGARLISRCVTASPTNLPPPAPLSGSTSRPMARRYARCASRSAASRPSHGAHAPSRRR